MHIETIRLKAKCIPCQHMGTKRSK